jgi:REP element-mobilizing transposase RayT
MWALGDHIYYIYMRKIKFVAGEYYHIYNHGVENRKIFLSNADYRCFLMSLIIFNNEQSCVYNIPRFITNTTLSEKQSISDGRDCLVDIIAFTLLSNHFHLFVKEIEENGISRFMHRLCMGYSHYFNLKYKRVGTLWQGNFGAKHINEEAYFIHIISYVHLNILDLYFPEWREGKIKNWKQAEIKMRNYLWSSYGYYRTGKDKTSFTRLILTKPDWFNEYFPTPKSFEENLRLWSSRNIDNT